MNNITCTGIRITSIGLSFLLLFFAAAASATPDITNVQLARSATEFTVVSGTGFGALKAKAHVDACSKPDYASCTNIQIQQVAPEDWDDSSIRLHLQNLREFRGESVYLYVIDKKGRVSNGIPLARPVMKKN